MNQAALKIEIENQVRERASLKKTKLLIERWFEDSAQNLEERIQVADWFRRLGHYRESYKVLEPEDWKAVFTTRSATDRRRLFWIARLMNLMGAPRTGLSLIRRLQARTEEEHRIAANVYLTNLHAGPALEHFKKCWSLLSAKQKKLYENQFILLGQCDAYESLNQCEEALRILKKVHIEPEWKLLKGIVAQARGEYLARQEKYKEAWISLQEASQYFNEKDPTPDFGYLLKWRGYVLGGLQKKVKARAEFDAAKEVLLKPQLRTEAWLHILVLAEKVGVATLEEKYILRSYPEILPGFTDPFGRATSFSLRESRPRLILCPFSGEYIEKGKWKWGLPKELRLLAMLLLSQPIGISAYRVKSALWADEWSAFLQLDARLDQLLNRLRKAFDIQVCLEEGYLRLIKPPKGVTVEIAPGPQRPMLLRDRETIRPVDIKKHYGLGKTATHQLLKDWILAGWLSVKARSVYTINPEDRPPR